MIFVFSRTDLESHTTLHAKRATATQLGPEREFYNASIWEPYGDFQPCRVEVREISMILLLLGIFLHLLCC